MVSNLSWPSSKNLLKGFDSICSNIILWTDGCSLDATLFSLTLLYNPVKCNSNYWKDLSGGSDAHWLTKFCFTWSS